MASLLPVDGFDSDDEELEPELELELDSEDDELLDDDVDSDDFSLLAPLLLLRLSVL